MSGLLAGSPAAWLLDTLLAFSALVALVLLIRRPVARIAGAEAAYMLWLIPALRWLMPPLALPQALQPFAARSLLAAPENVADMAAPIATTTVESNANIAASMGDSAVGGSWDISVALPLLWIGGALLLLGAALVHYALLRRKLARDARALGRVGAVRLFETLALSGPVATGWVRPAIFVPAGSRALPASAQEMALAHELTHHRAGHLWHNLAALALLSLNWFNPLAWMAWRAFIVDQEAACDARTLARYGFDRADYAQMLVTACTAAPRLLLPAPSAALISRKSLVARIRSISIGQDTPRRPRLTMALTAVGATVLLPLTASIAQDEPAPTRPQRSSQTVITIANQGGTPVLRKKIEQPGERIEIWTDHPISDAEADRLIAESRTAKIEAERARRAAEKAADKAAAAADAADADAANSNAARIRTRRILPAAPTPDCNEGCGDRMSWSGHCTEGCGHSGAHSAWRAEDQARRAADAALRQADWARAEAAKAERATEVAAQQAAAGSARAIAIADANGARAEARASAAAARIDGQAIRAEALAAAAQDMRDARAEMEREGITTKAQREALRALAEAERDLRRQAAR